MPCSCAFDAEPASSPPATASTAVQGLSTTCSEASTSAHHPASLAVNPNEPAPSEPLEPPAHAASSATIPAAAAAPQVSANAATFSAL